MKIRIKVEEQVNATEREKKPDHQGYIYTRPVPYDRVYLLGTVLLMRVCSHGNAQSGPFGTGLV